MSASVRRTSITTGTRAGGLHVHCDEVRLWELLSGEPSTWGKAEEVGYETEWVSVTDIGEDLGPRRSASAVLAELRRAGLLEGLDVAAASGARVNQQHGVEAPRGSSRAACPVLWTTVTRKQPMSPTFADRITENLRRWAAQQQQHGLVDAAAGY